MKKIKLPITQTVSATLDLKNIDPSSVIDLGNGRKAISFGELINESIVASIDMARTNGGLVLYATTSIEKQIESILLVFFMGPFTEPSSRRDMFEREVLESSALSFSAKKELLSKVVNEEDLLKGKEKSALQGYLKQIMTWRNAFAHGKVQHNASRGVVLKYYSGQPAELVLSDELWSNIEDTFQKTEKILKSVKQTIENT